MVLELHVDVIWSMGVNDFPNVYYVLSLPSELKRYDIEFLESVSIFHGMLTCYLSQERSLYIFYLLDARYISITVRERSRKALKTHAAILLTPSAECEKPMNDYLR